MKTKFFVINQIDINWYNFNQELIKVIRKVTTSQTMTVSRRKQETQIKSRTPKTFITINRR